MEKYTQKEKEILLSINKSFENIEEDFACLSADTQNKILEEHNPTGSLNHCIRWGLQAIGEIVGDFKD